jgi:UDP-N-acetylglucosamine 2-epimerase
MIKVITIIGTRPEGIKTAILHKKLVDDTAFHAILCSTGQHKDLLLDAIKAFDIEMDIELDSMTANSNIASQIAYMIDNLQKVINEHQPQLIIVQGDTLSAYCGAMIAFYNKIQLAHVEAGLRTYNKLSPFPEEVHRKYIDDVADYHFAHSEAARQILLSEGHTTQTVEMVGNTGIDALMYVNESLNSKILKPSRDLIDTLEKIDATKNLALLTLHRRETMGEQQDAIMQSLIDCAAQLNMHLICPKHPNPRLKELYKKYELQADISFIDALDYTSMVWLMNRVDMIYSDSGGIQEEAPYLGKNVIVLRQYSERNELIATGSNSLYDKQSLIEESKNLLGRNDEVTLPYGDGYASDRIIEILKSSYIKLNHKKL